MNTFRLILNWVSLLLTPIYLPILAFGYAFYVWGQVVFRFYKGRLTFDQQRVLKSGETWFWGFNV